MSVLHRALLSAAVVATLAGCGEGPAGDGTPRTIRDTRLKMGTGFDIQVVTTDERAGRAAINGAFDEIDRVEALLSEWKEDSEISELNRRAGTGAFAVGPELFEVLERANEIATQTGGAFDVTFATCWDLWSFGSGRIPESGELRECLSRVDYRRVRLDRASSTVTLPETGMRVGISGIGKGYGVDVAANVLEAHGLRNYIVDGGGDMRVAGRNVERSWTIGIAHPREAGRLAGTLRIDRGAVVSSGDYMQYFERDGVRYHHILDPSTGMPARRTLAVTVVAPDATTADALATGLFVMGPVEGLALVERLPDVEALFLSPSMEWVRSSGFPPLVKDPADP